MHFHKPLMPLKLKPRAQSTSPAIESLTNSNSSYHIFTVFISIGPISSEMMFTKHQPHHLISPVALVALITNASIYRNTRTHLQILRYAGNVLLNITHDHQRELIAPILFIALSPLYASRYHWATTPFSSIIELSFQLKIFRILFMNVCTYLLKIAMWRI